MSRTRGQKGQLSPPTAGTEARRTRASSLRRRKEEALVRRASVPAVGGDSCPFCPRVLDIPSHLVAMLPGDQPAHPGGGLHPAAHLPRPNPAPDRVDPPI